MSYGREGASGFWISVPSQCVLCLKFMACAIKHKRCGKFVQSHYFSLTISLLLGMKISLILWVWNA